MVGLAIAAGWVATGAVAVALMRRRGHDAFSWALLFLVLGPIAVPLAISSDRHRPAEPPRPLPPGGLDVLVFHDGTPDVRAALEAALTLLGAADDLDDAGRGRRPRGSVHGARAGHAAGGHERLDALARDVATVISAPLATVVLFGEPATALQHFALENGYEVIVAGRVAARSHVGSRHSGRGHKSVPVLIGPASS